MCLIGVTTLHSHRDSQGEISVKDVFNGNGRYTNKERENLLQQETSTKQFPPAQTLRLLM